MLAIGATELPEGATITLDGNEGAVFAGASRITEEVPQDLLERLDRLRGRRD